MTSTIETKKHNTYFDYLLNKINQFNVLDRTINNKTLKIHKLDRSGYFAIVYLNSTRTIISTQQSEFNLDKFSPSDNEASNFSAVWNSFHFMGLHNIKLQELISSNTDLFFYIDPKEAEENNQLGFESIHLLDNHIAGLTSGSLYCVPKYSSGSDYSGGLVTKSNYRVLKAYLEKNEIPFIDLYGNYGSYGISIPARIDNDELWEMIDSMENDYPLIDDEDHSNLLCETEDESWENWIKHDFIKAVNKSIDKELSIETKEDEENLQDLYHELKEKTNTYFEDNEEGGWIRIDSLVDIPTEDLEDLLTQYDLKTE